MRKFHGTKVLGLFAPGSKCSTERKFHGSESSLYGLFAPGNESAEERKGHSSSSLAGKGQFPFEVTGDCDSKVSPVSPGEALSGKLSGKVINLVAL